MKRHLHIMNSILPPYSFLISFFNLIHYLAVHDAIYTLTLKTIHPLLATQLSSTRVPHLPTVHYLSRPYHVCSLAYNASPKNATTTTTRHVSQVPRSLHARNQKSRRTQVYSNFTRRTNASQLPILLDVPIREKKNCASAMSLHKSLLRPKEEKRVLPKNNKVQLSQLASCRGSVLQERRRTPRSMLSCATLLIIIF